MAVLTSDIDPTGEQFQQNRNAMLALIGEFRGLEQKVRDS